MIVYCDRNECTHNDGMHCNCESISISDENADICDKYESIYNTSEYQQTYYKRVLTADKKVGALASKGKKIEYNGFVFFTDSLPSDDIFVTEERTGLGCGSFEKLKMPERWAKFVEIISKETSVNDYPLAVKIDGKCYLKCDIQKERADNENL